MTPPTTVKRAKLIVQHIDFDATQPHELNPKFNPPEGTPEYAALKASLDDEYFDPMVWNRRNGKMVSGHYRRTILMADGFKGADMVVVDWDEKQHVARMIAANQITGQTDDEKYLALMRQIEQGNYDLELTGITREELTAILSAAQPDQSQPGLKLAERFGVPPFSVLDARQGYWQDRKATWVALGIQSELGRSKDLITLSETAGAKWLGELRRVSPGGSPRPAMDYSQRQRGDGSGRSIPNAPSTQEIKTKAITDPLVCIEVEKHGEFFFKRDDLFEFGGANGGKVRILKLLCQDSKGIVTCGDRTSTQISRAALVAKALGIGCHIHTASGKDTPGMIEARNAGAEIIQHDPGYLTVLKKRAMDDEAVKAGWFHVPWANALPLAVSITAQQVPPHLPSGVKRIVVPVGSGCTLAGILRGLDGREAESGTGHPFPKVEVLGVALGADYAKQLDEFVPGWRKRKNLSFVKAKLPFHKTAPASDQTFEGVPLDAIYEAKCVPFLKPGDLLWIVGRSTSPAAPWNHHGNNTGPNSAWKGTGGKSAKTFNTTEWVKEHGLSGACPNDWTGTSIFDPVLTELAYRWFCPKDGVILDPFAGGSVRGIVAAWLGRHYIGVDLRPEQIKANEIQWARIAKQRDKKAKDGKAEWIEGDSRDMDRLLKGQPKADFVFSCPPYYDLEQYSDDPRDLSCGLTYTKFIGEMQTIVNACANSLKPDRFACFVVGDIRDKEGNYRNFVADTISLFLKAGMKLYNEAILVTAVGSLSIRVGKQFVTSRKLGKTHQNVLIFLKGDARKAVAAIGEVEFGQINEAEE